jgi:16S rRNA (uracil1498-N3)-methyltransferase
VAGGAAEQCGRAVVPMVHPTTTLGALLEVPFEGRRILFLETPGQPPLRAEGPRPASAMALVGPAGGWEPAEAARIQATGFQAAGLGPRVLRAETAAIAAVTVLQLVWGDLG